MSELTYISGKFYTNEEIVQAANHCCSSSCEDNWRCTTCAFQFNGIPCADIFARYITKINNKNQITEGSICYYRKDYKDIMCKVTGFMNDDHTVVQLESIRDKAVFVVPTTDIIPPEVPVSEKDIIRTIYTILDNYSGIFFQDKFTRDTVMDYLDSYNQQLTSLNPEPDDDESD